MNRKIAFIAIISIFITLFKFISFAESSGTHLLVLSVGNNFVYIDGEYKKIDSDRSIKPVIVKNRILVPVKFIGEIFGYNVEWEAKTKTIKLSGENNILQFTLDKDEILINDIKKKTDISAVNIKGKIYVPLRPLIEGIKQDLVITEKGLIVISDKATLENFQNNSKLNDQIYKNLTDSISYYSKSLTISTGIKKINVIDINLSSPLISFEAALPDNKLNNTIDFEKAVKQKGAFAAINGNFFSAYETIKDPIGNLFSNGKLIMGQTGFTTVGFTKDKQVIFANPSTFVSGYTDDIKENQRLGDGTFDYHAFYMNEVNTLSQSANNSIMYTKERGDQLLITYPGCIVEVVNDVVVLNRMVTKNEKIPILKEGYLLYFGDTQIRNFHSDLALKLGRKVTLFYNIRKSNNPDFKWENLNQAISGGPELIQNGEMCPPSIQAAFSGERFTTDSRLRTAIAKTYDNRLLLITIPNQTSLTIQELKEVMKALKVEEALNLDGGGSTAMYYDGKVINKPGRLLTTILYVYKN